jgi:hypothetical protein
VAKKQRVRRKKATKTCPNKPRRHKGTILLPRINFFIANRSKHYLFRQISFVSSCLRGQKTTGQEKKEPERHKGLTDVTDGSGGHNSFTPNKFLYSQSFKHYLFRQISFVLSWQKKQLNSKTFNTRFHQRSSKVNKVSQIQIHHFEMTQNLSFPDRIECFYCFKLYNNEIID